MVAQCRTNEIFVALNQRYEDCSHFDTSLCQCRARDLLNSDGRALMASLRTKTTMSMGVISFCRNLKLSRTVRLMTFLLTAFFIIFFAMARPSLGWSNSVLIASRVKYRSVDFTGFKKTFLNSDAFFNLSEGGNR